jgi:hypothetical protein
MSRRRHGGTLSDGKGLLMNFILKMSVDNDAFTPQPYEETARILRMIADRLKHSRKLRCSWQSAKRSRMGARFTGTRTPKRRAQPTGTMIGALKHTKC